MSFTKNSRSRSGNIDLATKTSDGLMSKEDYNKLSLFNNDSHIRVISFIIPEKLVKGVQQPHIIFPFDGVIKYINAALSIVGQGETSLTIEKSKDYIGWDDILQIPVKFLSQENFDNSGNIVSIDKVSSGDVFRLNIQNVSEGAANLTLNIGIDISNNN